MSATESTESATSRTDTDHGDSVEQLKTLVHTLATSALSSSSALQVQEVYEATLTDQMCRCHFVTCFESCKESFVSSTGTSAEEALFNATLENYAHLSRHYGTRHVRGSDFDLFHASLGDLEEYKNAAMTRKAEIDRFLGAIRDMTPESFAAASAFSHDVKRVVRIKLPRTAVWKCTGLDDCGFRFGFEVVGKGRCEAGEKARKQLLDGVDAHWRSCKAAPDARLLTTEDLLMAELDLCALVSTGSGLTFSRRPEEAVCGMWRQRLSLVLDEFLCRRHQTTSSHVSDIIRERYRVTLNSNIKRCIWRKKDGRRCLFGLNLESKEVISDDPDVTRLDLDNRATLDLASHVLCTHALSLDGRRKQDGEDSITTRCADMILADELEFMSFADHFKTFSTQEKFVNRPYECRIVKVFEVSLDHVWKQCRVEGSEAITNSESEIAERFGILDEDEDTACFRAFEELLKRADSHRLRHKTNKCSGKRELISFLLSPRKH